MKKITLFLITFFTYFCYSMDEELIVQPVEDKLGLEKGLQLAGLMRDTVFAKDSILTPEERAWVDEYRKTKLQKLLTISDRNDAFITNKEKQIVGFIASHLDEKKSTRIILDSIYLAEKKIPKLTSITYSDSIFFIENVVHFESTGLPNLEIIPLMLGYIGTKYPQATKFWTATLKKNNSGSGFLESQGFTQSDYMDSLHNPDIFQGWKRKIKK